VYFGSCSDVGVARVQVVITGLVIAAEMAMVTISTVVYSVADTTQVCLVCCRRFVICRRIVVNLICLKTSNKQQEFDCGDRTAGHNSMHL